MMKIHLQLIIHMQDLQLLHQAVMQQEHPSYQKVNMVTIHMQGHQLQPQVVMQDHPLQHREANMAQTMAQHQ